MPTGSRSLSTPSPTATTRPGRPTPRSSTRSSCRGRACNTGAAARGGLRHRQGHAPARPARFRRSPAWSPDRTSPRPPGQPGGLRRCVWWSSRPFEDWQPARERALRPDLRGNRVALDRPRRRLPARLALAAARRASWPSGPPTCLPAGGDPFFREIQDVYDEIGEGVPPGTEFAGPGEQPDRARHRGQRPVRRHRDPAFRLGDAATPPRRTSRCSTRSPATSTWPPGSATGSMARSAGASPPGRTAWCGGTGARSCTVASAGPPDARLAGDIGAAGQLADSTLSAAQRAWPMFTDERRADVSRGQPDTRPAARPRERPTHDHHVVSPARRKPALSHCRGAAPAGPVDPAERIELTVITRRAAGSAARRCGAPVRLSRAELRSATAPTPPITSWWPRSSQAIEPAIQVTASDPGARRITVAGPAGALARRVRHRAQPGRPARPARAAGHPPLPQRRPADPGRARRRHRRGTRPGQPAAGQRRTSGSLQPRRRQVSYTPPQVAELYQFPAGTDGTGQTVAIIELGGGFAASRPGQLLRRPRHRDPVGHGGRRRRRHQRAGPGPAGRRRRGPARYRGRRLGRARRGAARLLRPEHRSGLRGRGHQRGARRAHAGRGQHQLGRAGKLLDGAVDDRAGRRPSPTASRSA